MMQTLLQRLESLTGPDREVSDEVLFHCGWKLSEEGRLDNPSLWWEAPNGDSFLNGDQPHPTASIDDALLGVPEGFAYQVAVGGDRIKSCMEHVDSDNPRIFRHPNTALVSDNGCGQFYDGATPAIALCIAIVKARGGV